MFQETNEIRSEMNMLSTTMVDLYTHQIAMDDQVPRILHYQKVQQAMSFVNAILACIPLAGGVAVHVLSGGLAILENLDGEDFAVSGMVESLFGVGKDWSSFITEPLVERFIRAGDVVLDEVTWNELPEANRRAVVTAANGLGLPIQELRRRLRVATQEAMTASCAIVPKEFEEGDNRRSPDGNEETIEESSQNLSTAQNGKGERTKDLPFNLREEENEERDISQFSQAVAMIQQQMKE